MMLWKSPTKIIALITKIQMKHKNNNNQLSIKGSHGTQTQLSLLAFLLYKGTQFLYLKLGVATFTMHLLIILWTRAYIMSFLLAVITPSLSWILCDVIFH